MLESPALRALPRDRRAALRRGLVILTCLAITLLVIAISVVGTITVQTLTAR